MQVIDEPLSQGETDKLRKWLDDPALLIFVRVVESLAFKCECQAAERVIKGTGQAADAAGKDILDAQKTRHVLELMREFRPRKNFHVSRAVPTVIK